MSGRVSAIVVAAGKSQRMGFDKMLTPIVGQPLLYHTLARLGHSPEIAEIILVIRPEMGEQIAKLLPILSQNPPIRVAYGGAERQDSVRAGLDKADAASEYVLIQDAARPFISPELINLVLKAAEETGAAVCGQPCSDTVKQAGPDGVVEKTLDRSKIWTVQTPQIFRRELLAEAYAAVAARKEIVTDDTAAVEALGRPVRIVPFHGVNLKVTKPSDWKLAAAYLAMEPDSPIGQELRKLVHDFNNHLTPLMGYAFLVENEFPPESKGRKFSANIQAASDKTHKVSLQIQKIIRELFPRKEELPPPDGTD